MEIFLHDFMDRECQLSCIQTVKSTLRGFLKWKHQDLPTEEERLMVQTTTLQRSLKGQIVAPSRPGWHPIRWLRMRFLLFQEERG